jgi:hypothetical protein
MPWPSVNGPSGTYVRDDGFTIVPAQDSSAWLSFKLSKIDLMAGSKKEPNAVEADGR